MTERFKCHVPNGNPMEAEITLNGEPIRCAKVEMTITAREEPTVRVELLPDDIDFDIGADLSLTMDQTHGRAWFDAARIRAWHLVNRRGYDPYNHCPA